MGARGGGRMARGDEMRITFTGEVAGPGAKKLGLGGVYELCRSVCDGVKEGPTTGGHGASELY